MISLHSPVRQRNQHDSILSATLPYIFGVPQLPRTFWPSPFVLTLLHFPALRNLSSLAKPPKPTRPNRIYQPSPSTPSEALAGAIRDSFPLIAPKPPQPANPAPALKQIMPRPPKNKAIEPAKIAVAPPRHIDVDNFIRVRDSVSQSNIVSLLTSLTFCTASHRQRVCLRHRVRRITTLSSITQMSSRLCIRHVIVPIRESRIAGMNLSHLASPPRNISWLEQPLLHRTRCEQAIETT
jgi:hypothetical protein